MKINQRIKALRKHLGLTQKAFAEELGYSRSYISEVEKGVKSPSEKFLKQLGLRYGNDYGFTQRTYRQPPERMLPRGHGDAPDSDRGSYGIPEAEGYGVTGVITRLSPAEMALVEALREIDPISRIGVYVSAINQLNEARRDKEVQKDKRKKRLIDRAIKELSKAMAGGG